MTTKATLQEHHFSTSKQHHIGNNFVRSCSHHKHSINLPEHSSSLYTHMLCKKLSENISAMPECFKHMRPLTVVHADIG